MPMDIPTGTPITTAITKAENTLLRLEIVCSSRVLSLNPMHSGGVALASPKKFCSSCQYVGVHDIFKNFNQTMLGGGKNNGGTQLCSVDIHQVTSIISTVVTLISPLFPLPGAPNESISSADFSFFPCACRPMKAPHHAVNRVMIEIFLFLLLLDVLRFGLIFFSFTTFFLAFYYFYTARILVPPRRVLWTVFFLALR